MTSVRLLRALRHVGQVTCPSHNLPIPSFFRQLKSFDTVTRLSLFLTPLDFYLKGASSVLTHADSQFQSKSIIVKDSQTQTHYREKRRQNLSYQTQHPIKIFIPMSRQTKSWILLTSAKSPNLWQIMGREVRGYSPCRSITDIDADTTPFRRGIEDRH